MCKLAKAIYLLALLASTNAPASDINPLTCEALHLDTNKPVPVRIVSAITSQRIATAQWPLGYPTIAINESEFSKLPQLTRQFIYYHECAHLVKQIKDEVKVDCVALEMMRHEQQLSKRDIRLLVDERSTPLGLTPRWTNLLKCDVFVNPASR